MNREEAVAAKTRISQDDLFAKVINDRESIDDIVKKKNEMSIATVEAVQKYFKREKDPLEAGIKQLKAYGMYYNTDRATTFVEPGFKAMIGDKCHASKPITFEERVDRMFKKIKAGTANNTNNFKNTNYELDT